MKRPMKAGRLEMRHRGLWAGSKRRRKQASCHRLGRPEAKAHREASIPAPKHSCGGRQGGGESASKSVENTVTAGAVVWMWACAPGPFLVGGRLKGLRKAGLGCAAADVGLAQALALRPLGRCPLTRPPPPSGPALAPANWATNAPLHPLRFSALSSKPPRGSAMDRLRGSAAHAAVSRELAGPRSSLRRQLALRRRCPGGG